MRPAWLGRTFIGRFAGDVLRISGAIGLAQVVAVAAMPLITRLYSSEAFGHFALFNATVTILMPLASLRYEFALPLPSEESSALDLLTLCLALVVGSSLAVALLSLLLWPIFAEWTRIRGQEMMFLPLALLALGLNAVMTSWLVRNRAFSQLAHVRFATMVGTVACQIALGQLSADSTGLILGFVGGYLLGFALAVYQCHAALFAAASRGRVRNVWGAAAEYYSFAVISAPSGIVNAVGSQGPSIVLLYLYGPAITGQFSLAQRVLSQPMVFAGQAVKQVLWGNAARLLVDDPGRLWPLFLRVNAFLLAAMAPGLILIWFGGAIFAFVFGSAWAQAGDFAGVMVPAAFLGLAAFGTTALELYRLNHWMSAWECLRLALVVGALAAAWRMNLPPMVCVVAVTAASAVANVTLLGLNAVSLRRPFQCGA